MYALGMSGSPGVLAVSEAKPASVAEAAAEWWMEEGPAIRS
jgi:hypothetical protein